MNGNQTIQLVEIPIGGKDGAVWNRLHEEREELCETLVGITRLDSAVNSEFAQTPELAHARLRQIDDALDRLMSGSYGICSACGHPINEMKLYIDPATSLCIECAESKPASTTVSSEPATARKARNESQCVSR